MNGESKKMNHPMQMCSEWLAGGSDRRIIMIGDAVHLECDAYLIMARGGSSLEERLTQAFAEAAKHDGEVKPAVVLRVKASA